MFKYFNTKSASNGCVHDNAKTTPPIPQTSSAIGSGDASTTKSDVQPLSPSSADPNIDLVSETMKQWTVREREDVYDDIHGIVPSSATSKSSAFVDSTCSTTAKVHQEDEPGFLSKCLFEMERQLNAISNHEKQAYTTVERKNFEYATREILWVQFLRSVNYSPKNAARKMTQYFQFKLELFGSDLLLKEYITLADLDEGDVECITQGLSISVPISDRSNRPVKFCCPWFIKPPTSGRVFSTQNKVRTMWYMSHIDLRKDPERLKNGSVAIFWSCPPPKRYKNGEDLSVDLVKHSIENSQTERHAFGMGTRCTQVVPVKWSAIHVCSPTRGAGQFFINLAAIIYEKQTRTRLCIHNGTPLECLYKLIGYGIPIDALPITDQGNRRLICHLDMLSKMKQTEEAENKRLDSTTRAMSPIPNNKSGTNDAFDNKALLPSGGSMASASQEIKPKTHMQSPMAGRSLMEWLSTVGESASKQQQHQQSDLIGQTETTNEAAPLNHGLISQTLNLQPQQTVPIRLSSLDWQKVSTDTKAITPNRVSERDFGDGRDTSEGSLVKQPNSTDVLLGRGRKFNKHPGNIKLHSVITGHVEEYEQRNRIRKLLLAEDIVDSLKKSGVRFLGLKESEGEGEDGNYWYVVSDKVARERVSHTFRNKRQIAKAKAKKDAKTRYKNDNNMQNRTEDSANKTVITLENNIVRQEGAMVFNGGSSILSRPVIGDTGSESDSSCYCMGMSFFEVNN